MNTTTVTREQISKMLWSDVDTDIMEDMWLVSVVWKDKMGFLNNTHCYFKERYFAEKWFNDNIVSKDFPYYAWCCDGKYWSSNVCELLGD